MERLRVRIAVLTFVGGLTACASDSSDTPADPTTATSAEPAPEAPKPAEQPATQAKSSSEDPYAKSKEGKSEELPSIDPEEALAAIPDTMKPATLVPELKNKLLVPDLNKGGVAMFTDVVTIKPGEDVTFCTYVPGTTDSVMYIHDTLGSQSKWGHHSILQYSTKAQEAGTRRCSQESQEAQQGQIIGGTGGEGTGAIKLPDDIVSEVPAGAQFIINHHWINQSDAEIEAQAEMITVPSHADPSELRIARALSIAVLDFKVMPKEDGEQSGECTFEQDMDMLSMIGHEHQWGTHVKAERMRDDGSDVIFDHDYDESMVSHPKTTSYAADAPFQFSKGDRVRMTCNWANTSNMELVFPREMCILFGWRLGGDKDTSCAKGKWR
jgi:hypothetical protein